MLAICIHEDRIIVFVSFGIFETSLDCPGIAKIKEIGDAIYISCSNDILRGIRGAVIDNYRVEIWSMFFNII